MTSGKVRLNPRVDAGEVVAAAMDTVRPAADAKRLEFKGRSRDAGARLRGRRPPSAVVWNLLQNGVKFTPSGGTVEASLARRNSYVEIAITDSGVGVEPEFLPFMFDTFRQADSSASRKHGGLGLGLAIVKRLVELHGGLVEARSEGPGRGTTVTIRLPLMALTTAVKAGTPEANERPAPAWKCSVLVVDDPPTPRVWPWPWARPGPR